MSKSILFSMKAWDSYLYWQEMSKDKIKKINELIKECRRNPFEGRGKPEPLRGDLAGMWSRRIDEEHRLIYRYDDGVLTIVSCRYHYN